MAERPEVVDRERLVEDVLEQPTVVRAEIVSPRSMLLRVDMIASSTIALPDVFAVISSPSRIGTPELISVDSVRQNRATAIFRMIGPSTGALSTVLSTVRRPPSVE